MTRWLWLNANGRHRYRSTQPAAGLVANVGGALRPREIDLPETLGGCEILQVPVGDGHELGVFKDRRLGAYAAVMAVQVRSFGLRPASEQERGLGRWGEVLASCATVGGALRRIQVLERTVPCDGDVMQRYHRESRDPSLPHDAAEVRSYEALLEASMQVTQDHEVLVVVSIDERRARSVGGREVRERRLSKDELACVVLIRELQTLASRFDRSDVVVSGLLSPSEYARALRLAFDPYQREHANGIAVDPAAWGPTGADTGWDTYRADGAWHRTYWIAQWPRRRVPPTFLGELLLGGQAVRAVSLVFEPVAPDKARHQAEAAITHEEANDEQRRKHGFLTTARKRRSHETAIQRDTELAQGFEEVRFAGLIAVSGRTLDELETASRELEQAAMQARLDLQPLVGEQDSGFCQAALPIGRGLRSNGPLGRRGG